MPLQITELFEHNRNRYQFVVFHLADDPLSYRFIIEDRTSSDEPLEVYNVIRTFDSEVGHSDPIVDNVIRNEFEYIRDEFIESLQNPSS